MHLTCANCAFVLKCLFSDLKEFCISFGNRGPRNWRKDREAQNPKCLMSNVKFPQSMMIWAAMASAGVGGGWLTVFLS